MTQAFHSQLNTWLLGVLSLFMACGVALAGFVLHAVYDINGTVKAHDIAITEAAKKSDKADERTTRIEAKVDSVLALVSEHRQESRQ